MFHLTLIIYIKVTFGNFYHKVLWYFLIKFDGQTFDDEKSETTPYLIRIELKNDIIGILFTLVSAIYLVSLQFIIDVH